jgi:hypothetical protein
MGRKVPDVIGMPEPALGDGSAFYRFDDVGVRLPCGGKTRQSVLINGGEAAGEGGFGHGILLVDRSK